MIPVLDETAVGRLLRMDALIPAMAEALRDLSAGRIVQPVRLMLPVAERGFFAAMPAYTGGGLGAKLVTFFPGNVGLPTHHATILLFDPDSGAPLAMLDGRLITEMRTAAVSAVATRHLARPDARVLAILGSGVQAGSHLEALRLVRDLEEVRVWSPRNAAAFAERHGVRAAASVPEAVRGADLIVVATNARTPVLRGEWLSPGAHVNAVGACRPDWRELDDDLVRGARLYVESREAASRESGDVMAGTVVAELGEVVAGTAPGRRTDDEVTLFKSVGVAAEDIATAVLVYGSVRPAPPPG
jgi:ornithine cyclodeaminase/alanine dehydrogenase-like protein (mu-crystallin family)